MPVPGMNAVMLPVLQVVSGGKSDIVDITDLVSDHLNLSQAEREEMLPSGKQRKMYNRVEWAVSYLVQAKLLKRTRRRHVAITPRGIAVLERPPSVITPQFLRRFEEYRHFEARSTQPKQPDTQQGRDDSTPLHLDEYGQFEGKAVRSRQSDAWPDRAAPAAPMRLEEIKQFETRSAHTQQPDTGQDKAAASDLLRQQLVAKLRQVTLASLQGLAVALMQRMGYGSRRQPPLMQPAGPDSVDGIIDADPLGFERIYLCIHRADAVKVEAVQGFARKAEQAAATRGVFITTGQFTVQARQAISLSSRPLVLVDGGRLVGLMLDWGVGVRSVRGVISRQLDMRCFDRA